MINAHSETMNDTTSRGTALRHLWRLLLDGDTAWGSMSVRPQRWGATSYRIVIYPPGLTAEERRRVRLWRGFPEWGSALWMSAAVVVSGFTEPGAAAVIASAGTLTAGAAAFAAAKHTRKLVRSAQVTVPTPNSDISLLVRARLIETVGTAMVNADARVHSGELSPTGHEVIWWRAYEQLERDTAIPAIGRYGSVR